MSAVPAVRGPGGERVAGGRRRVTSRLPLAVWLALVWTGLWGDVSWANVLGGVAVAVLLLLALPLPATPGGSRLRPGPVLRLAVVFAVDLVKANVVVALQVLRASLPGGGRMRQAVVAVPIRSTDDRLVTVVANMISLTPGTLTLEVDRVRRLLYVHVLDLDSREALRAEVRRLEDRVVTAFGSSAALAELEEADRADGRAGPSGSAGSVGGGRSS